MLLMYNITKSPFQSKNSLWNHFNVMCLFSFKLLTRLVPYLYSNNTRSWQTPDSLRSRDGWLIFVTCVVDLEIVGPGKKMIAGTALQLFWGVGMLILVGAAYLLRDWRHLNIAMTYQRSYSWLISGKMFIFLKKNNEFDFNVNLSYLTVDWWFL